MDRRVRPPASYQPETRRRHAPHRHHRHQPLPPEDSSGSPSDTGNREEIGGVVEAVTLVPHDFSRGGKKRNKTPLDPSRRPWDRQTHSDAGTRLCERVPTDADPTRNSVPRRFYNRRLPSQSYRAPQKVLDPLYPHPTVWVVEVLLQVDGRPTTRNRNLLEHRLRTGPVIETLEPSSPVRSESKGSYSRPDYVRPREPPHTPNVLLAHLSRGPVARKEGAEEGQPTVTTKGLGGRTYKLTNCSLKSLRISTTDHPTRTVTDPSLNGRDPFR